MGKLQLHSGTINQLHWAPLGISAPILLSVNCDELAWWNIAFLKSDKAMNRRSRMGIVRSNSNPNGGTSVRISNSLSADLQTFNLGDESCLINGNYHKVDNYWSKQEGKDPKRPALLGVVQLPPSCSGKVNVCVSSDFAKFLTADVHGVVSNYTLFGLS